jgi:hypothetical protein
MGVKRGLPKWAKKKDEDVPEYGTKKDVWNQQVGNKRRSKKTR